MAKYDFDRSIDRHGTQCKKIEILKQDYGRDDLLPLWIADMDFAVCPEITETLVHLAKKHGVIVLSDEIFGDLLTSSLFSAIK